ncbi:TPA: FkbM family methyltransferase [Candidatus Poribacteria bacterium]|nr:FkbM family methyltransferase [Candidatus Poribacteria bacterium]
MSISQYGSLFKMILRARDVYTLSFTGSSLLKRKIFGTKRNLYSLNQKLLNFKDVKFLSYGDMIGIYKEIFVAEYLTALDDFVPKKGDIIFDVGAGEGFYSILMKQKVNDISVYAFEPFPDIQKILQYHLDVNGINNVTIVPKALYNNVGRGIYFFKHDYGNGFVLSPTEIDKNSLSTMASCDSYTKIPIEFDTIYNFVQTMNIARIDILKVDVEGAEMKVLEGAKEFLSNVKKIVIEVHSTELKEQVNRHLSEFGFNRIPLDTYKSWVIRGIDYYINNTKT